jgi:hypothetical protein
LAQIFPFAKMQSKKKAFKHPLLAGMCHQRHATRAPNFSVDGSMIY